MSELPPTPGFEPIVTRKATDLIADQIRQRIFAREFRTGEMLPSEAELVRQTASSSASVRGALRALEAQGLVQMRSGRAGGAIVRLPGEDELAATVYQLIRGQAIGLEELLEMQQAIEPVCAELAARHRTEEDLRDLRGAITQMKASEQDLEQMMEAHSRWHITVARASGNELLSGLMSALVQWIFAAVRENRLEIPRVGSSAYEEITSAVTLGDAAAARAAMRDYATSRAEALGRGLRRGAEN
ncbi:MAG TPA: FCD domain-containing protein [Microbacterium sp.]|nr:FCD domain-containing protein [Microbacterium sp.]